MNTQTLSQPLPFWNVPKYNLATDHNSLYKLFNNELSVIELPGFATHHECYLMEKALAEVGYESYLNVYPPINRIGVTQYEAKKMGKDWYFQKVEEEYKKQKRAFASSFNPIERLVRMLKHSLPNHKVSIAYEDTDSYYAGLVRQINNTALIHADYAPYDAAQWKIANITDQIAWNLCIKSPITGGQCVVYNRQWNLNNDEKYLIPDSYGYMNEVVKITDRKIINPVIGECYFFNSRNFHEVLAGEGDRITISCFIGLNRKNNEILIWS